SCLISSGSAPVPAYSGRETSASRTGAVSSCRSPSWRARPRSSLRRWSGSRSRELHRMSRVVGIAAGQAGNLRREALGGNDGDDRAELFAGSRNADVDGFHAELRAEVAEPEGAAAIVVVRNEEDCAHPLTQSRLRSVQRLLHAERLCPLKRRFLQLQRGLLGGDRVEPEARDEQRILAGETARVVDRRGLGEHIAELARGAGKIEAEHLPEGRQRGEVRNAVRLRPLGSTGA